MKRRIRITALAVLAAMGLAGPAQAQVAPSHVPLGAAQGLFYRPEGRNAHVAFLIVHRTSDYLRHIGCTELPRRGFAALCMNTRFVNNELLVDWDRIALDVKEGVAFLRRQPGIRSIVLLGHSGGGPTLSFYQAVAEAGTAFCQDPRKLVPCRDDLAGLPSADALILADAHPGVPVILLRSLNGAVLDETPGRFDPGLDPYKPANGYDPNGSSRYTAEFQARYYAAQSARMNRLTDDVLARRQRIAEGRGPYPDNDIVVIPHGGNPGPGPGGASQLHSLDTAAPLRRTMRPQQLLRNDGSILRQIVQSVSPPELDTFATTNSFDRGTKLLSIRSYLSTQAVRSINSLDGIDHCSSNNSTVCAVGSISKPLLIMGMTGYLFIRDSEEEFEAARSADKDLVFIEGATHGFTPCRTCDANPDAFQNSVRNMFDYIARWVGQRFPG
ncbi:alpha/beta hydrolase (plasmid) [Roseomonas sp. OT10]|uniref:alpha/beta hydrolase n=1 Tax=Roseomonas cutis TaxID=2897332 RepID=UPI001E50AAA8|nr:alpha/beta hydrolase [Roseomonas sp. OT10]UFN51750.1 alpha/beta hydrolase [Roseomonas sp. OT10]